MSEQPVGKVPLHIKEYAKARDRLPPSAPDAMVEAPRPYPHATGEGTKYQECYSFDDGSLTVRTTGHGKQSGTGWLCFPEDALEQEQDDETGKGYQVVNLANSELIFLRDTLNTIFPEAMAAKDSLLQAFMEENPPLTNAALRSELAAKDAELAELRAQVEKYETLILKSIETLLQIKRRRA